MNNIYKIVGFIDNDTNSFTGNSPKLAADNAFKYLMKFTKLSEDDYNTFQGKFIVFTLRNISTNQEYKYIATRIKLNNKVLNNNKQLKTYKDVIAVYKKELEKL